jgi:hypothetical protein
MQLPTAILSKLTKRLRNKMHYGKNDFSLYFSLFLLHSLSSFTHSLSLSLSSYFTLSLALSLFLSPSLSLTLYPNLSLSLSLSLSRDGVMQMISVYWRVSN